MGQTPVRLPSRLREAVRVAVRLPSRLQVVVGRASSVAKISDMTILPCELDNGGLRSGV